jgi:murein DD-endopeptidase MepM/ murein hydrolase activator NlpD
VLPTHLAMVGEYREPPCPYCAGRRGIEYALAEGEPVLAAASGEVSFAGVVGGVRYVVVRTGSGALITHGFLRDVGVQQGERVRQGATLGQSTGRLFIGVRLGGKYVDPQSALVSDRGWCRGTERRPRAVLVG